MLILCWWSFDGVVLFLLGWHPALTIVNTDSTCQGQHWELQFPWVTWGRGKEKKNHIESTLADGRLEHLVGHPGNSRDLRWRMQTWPQVFSYGSWQCFISVASAGRHKHTLLLLSLLNQDSSAYLNSPSKYKWREQCVVYIIITVTGLVLAVYQIREKHIELIHEFASLYYLSYRAQTVSLVPILLSSPMFYLWKFVITFS